MVAMPIEGPRIRSRRVSRSPADTRSVPAPPAILLCSAIGPVSPDGVERRLLDGLATPDAVCKQPCLAGR